MPEACCVLLTTYTFLSWNIQTWGWKALVKLTNGQRASPIWVWLEGRCV